MIDVFGIKLKAVAVSKKLKEYKGIKSLMCRAFPKNEQIPMWLLHILAIRKSVEFSAYYDEDLFCGISYTVSNEELVFILYLAVNDKIHSKGYGSAILQCIKQRFSNKAIALNIEPLDPKSDNYAQRIKRFEFYLKNGFVDTHYQILATTTQFPIKEYKLTIKQLSFGLYSPQIKEHTN